MERTVEITSHYNGEARQSALSGCKSFFKSLWPEVVEEPLHFREQFSLRAAYGASDECKQGAALFSFCRLIVAFWHHEARLATFQIRMA